jgi:hypothetical protein
VLAFFLCLVLIASIVLEWWGLPGSIGATPGVYVQLAPFCLTLAGGALGGTLFAMKWLYHSVAKFTWNQDRLLWRLFTPALSSGVALIVFTLASSRVLPLFGNEIIETQRGALGISLLVGYFSDKALSRLERFATQHLGDSREKDSQKKNPNAATSGSGETRVESDDSKGVN